VEGGVARDVPFAGLEPPPGAELFRLATVNDVHIGLEEFGFLPLVRDALGGTPSERCLRAAVTEATAWGARLLVGKGDLTERGTVDQAARAASLLAAGGVPVEAVVGNHEVHAAAEPLGPVFAQHGIEVVQDGVRVRDLPGVRLVLFDSTVPGKHIGTYGRFADDVCDAVAEADGPAIVLTHHHPMALPFPTYWPPGVPSPGANRFFDRIVRANPRVLMSTGHTHRHRRHDHGPMVITEVGSPQHYPGTWAGYVVHEGGIRQVVRRVAAPDAIAWTEQTRRSVLGVWARWSPGRIQDRCFSIAW
jgi:3',5'-cyclic AMP phosphodiesterase CpdA